MSFPPLSPSDDCLFLIKSNDAFRLLFFLRYVLGHLLTAFELYEEHRVRIQTQTLLQVARRLLGKIGDLGQLLRGVRNPTPILFF